MENDEKEKRVYSQSEIFKCEYSRGWLESQSSEKILITHSFSPIGIFGGKGSEVKGGWQCPFGLVVEVEVVE